MSLSHLDRLRALMDERGYDAIVLRRVCDLRWLLGCERVFDDECAHTAFICADEAWLHTDSRYYNALVERLGAESAWQVDMESVAHPDWVARKAAAKRVHVLAVEDSLTLAFYEALQGALAARSLAVMMPRLHGDLTEMRAVKDASELALMRAAQRVTDAAFEHMCAWLHPGITEKEARAELDGFMLSHGADGLAFATIVASGPNTANPHAQPGDRVIEQGDFVLMDYGAAACDYKSDMTRTVVVGKPTEKQQALYDLVRSVNEACEAYVKPGVVGRSVHELAVRLISEAGYGDYFKHGLGHGVGVEIHEEPRLSAADEHVLVPGNVVTVEPGVYLPGFGGVRLEDYGVVTETGIDIFTQSTHELLSVGA